MPVSGSHEHDAHDRSWVETCRVKKIALAEGWLLPESNRDVRPRHPYSGSFACGCVAECDQRARGRASEVA